MDHKKIANKYSVNRKRTLSLVALSLGLAMPSALQALTMGDINTKSYLNQPLAFELPIKTSKGERVGVDNIVVSLASSDEYSRHGLVYPWGLGTIKLQAQRQKGGKLIIRGKSEKAVRDLIVFLLIKLETPAGTIYKEYSALIDPKNAGGAAPVVIQRSNVGAPAKKSKATAQFGTAAVPAPASSTARSFSSDDTPPQVRHSQQRPARQFRGFGSQQDYRDYKVRAGDSLSVIAQQLRGDVKLPLHHYIGAITALNSDTFQQGLGNLEVGQVIKVPNPKLVASTYSQQQRRLEAGSHQYRVKYGDSLFLIAKAFRPAEISEADYIRSLREQNPELGRGSHLEPGIVINIPNPSSSAEANAAAATTELAANPSADGAPFVAEALPSTESLAVDKVPAPQTATETAVEAPIIQELPTQKLGATSEANETSAPNEASTASDTEIGNAADTLSAAEAEAGEIANLASAAELADAELMAKNTEMQQQIDDLNSEIYGLKNNVVSLNAENKDLNSKVVSFKEQQQQAKKSQNFIMLGLGALAALLAVLCLLFYGKARQLARRLAGIGNSTPVVNTSGAQSNKPRVFGSMFGSKEPAETANNNSGEKDYSNYDFSKSNYDYSQLYDIDKLKEDIKSTGSSAFVQTGGTIELDDSEDDLDTVREFINSQHYEVADKLLAKMRDEDPDNLEYQLTWLELLMRRGHADAAAELAQNLREQFPDNVHEVEEAIAGTNEWLEAQQDAEEPLGPLERATLEGEETADEAETGAETNELDSFDEGLAEDERLYEVRVYMSYGHDEMAQNALEEYLQDNPNNIEAMILKLELYLRGDNPGSAVVLAEQIKQNHELSDTQAKEIDGLLAAAKRSMSESDSNAENTTAAVSAEDLMLDEFDALLEKDSSDTELTEFIDDNERTQIMGELDEVVLSGEDDIIEIESQQELQAGFAELDEEYAGDTQTIIDELSELDELNEPLDSDKLGK